MVVKVLGTGCPTCKALMKNVQEVVEDLGIDAVVEKIEDITKIMNYGIMSVPALVIDEQVKFYGKSPKKEELQKYFLDDR